MINEVINLLNNPRVSIFELERNFFKKIKYSNIDMNQIEAIMATMVTDNITIGLSNNGMNAMIEMAMQSANEAYSQIINRNNTLSLQTGMTR